MALSSILVPAVASTNWGAEGLIVLRIICGFGAVRFDAIEHFYQYDYRYYKSFKYGIANFEIAYFKSFTGSYLSCDA